MDKQAQDRLWSELSEDYKEDHKHFYEAYKDYEIETCFYTICRQMEKTFGTHNLNPKPQIKTWEDIEKTNIDWSNIDIDRLNTLDAITPAMRNKLIATYKIAKLIELGYGGMVSEEYKSEIPFNPAYYSILPDKDKGFKIVERQWVDYGEFVCFHLHSQAEEFMSHESNRKLAEQYYLL